MKERLNVYYASVPNMGDILNKDIIEKCFGYKVARKSYLTAKISGIGSGLGNYTYEGEAWKKFLKAISGIVYPEVYIWGTGFIRYKEIDDNFYKPKMHICAVRGELSRKRVERILGHRINIPLGDAGILASYLLEDDIKKSYDVGIIAHYKEQTEPIFSDLLKKYPNSCFIDVRKKPIDVVKAIAQCNIILSSSLHGLIIADSLRIPNKHIVVTDNLLGDGFKFDDYYSAYDLNHEYIDLRVEELKSLSKVIDEYKITDSMMDEKKADMLNCFPFPRINK